MDAAAGGSAVLFAGWRFDPVLPALSRRDASGAWHAAPLGSRALGILGLLLERRGDVVSKDCIIRAVWPTTTVEPNNLTVQIAALRRVLDDGRQGDSLIQTVPGQGYRLACNIEAETYAAAAPQTHPSTETTPPGRRNRLMDAIGPQRRRTLVMVALAVVSSALVWLVWSGSTPAPLAAMVSVGFDGDGPSRTFARDLADEIAADFNQVHLSEFPRDFVIGPGPGVTDAALLRRSSARYALLGKLHRSGTLVKLDAQLVETQAGAQLWSQRLDIDPENAVAARRDAARRIESGMGPAVLTAERHRRQQERPTRPTATDLTVQALLVAQLPPSPQRLITERDLYERALQLDPSSFFVKAKLVILLMDSEDYNPTGFKSVLERTRGLVSDLRAASPNSEMALRTYAQWLHWQEGRCPEAIEAARKLLDLYPGNVQADRWLAQCLVLTGRAEEAVPWAERAIETATLSDAWQFSNFRTMGDVMLDLGRFKEAIAWNRRALAADPDNAAEAQSWRLSHIAGAEALDGDIVAAKQTMASALALWPYRTVRTDSPSGYVNTASPAGARRLQDAYRLTGLRDHADEAADFGVAPIGALQQAAAGYTSLTLLGATTLRTDDVARLVAGSKMLIIDTVTRNSGRSLPGAIGLRYVGAGGSLSDLAQDRLGQTMQQLTKGDLTTPILAVGWNSESFDGTNLALRLVALGYRNVYWYRGGREAWEASGAPEAPLTIREW